MQSGTLETNLLYGGLSPNCVKLLHLLLVESYQARLDQHLVVMIEKSFWVYRISTLHHAYSEGRSNHVLDRILHGHLLSVLSGFVCGLEPDVTLHDYLLLLSFELLLSLCRANLDFSLIDFILLMLLSKLSLHLLKHFLLDHAPEGILHGVTCRFESAEASIRLGLLLLELTLDLRVEQDLDEALSGALQLLVQEFFSLHVFLL